jgi:hypothetical protein
MKMIMEHWWNDSDRVKPKYSEQIRSHCHFVHHDISHGLIRDQTRASEVKVTWITYFSRFGSYRAVNTLLVCQDQPVSVVQREAEVWVCSVLSSAPDRDGFLIPHLAAVPPGKSPGFHYGRSVVGPMAGLDVYGEDKMSYPIGIRTPALSDLLYWAFRPLGWCCIGK